jgi:hypothetical protein
MVRCPVCESVQIGFFVSPRPTSCYYCKATWLQDGSEQTAVQGAQARRDDVSAREGGHDFPPAGAGRFGEEHPASANGRQR